MRPIDKGSAPRTYSDYSSAKNDLMDRLGACCCYCEVTVRGGSGGAVEHKLPQERARALNRPDLIVEWDNFLLACTNCNSIKRDKYISSDAYYWPDSDNTFRAFSYDMGVLMPSPIADKAIIKRTVDLTGLDRRPGHPKHSPKDLRFKHRVEAYHIASDSLTTYEEAPGLPMAHQIARTAAGQGFFSVWMTVFAGHPVVKNEIIKQFKGTAVDCFDAEGGAIPRQGGRL